MKIYCYKDGKITTSYKAFVSVYDIGILRGYAIYEGITAFGKQAFYLKEHLERFRKSAKELELKIPISDNKIKNIINTLIQKNSFERTNLRIILSGGNTLEGINYNPNDSTFFILAEKWTPLPKKLYEKGAKLITENYLRFMPSIKTTHYITAVKLQPKRKKENAVEILYTSNRKALECSTSNIFMFLGNTLITPKNNVLGGITRLITLKLAKKYFKIEERDIKIEELLKADEVFITSSFKDILPITQINNTRIGSGIVGKNTKRIMDLFSELTQK